MTIELRALQALRLKGRATAADIGSVTGASAGEVGPALAELAAAGHCAQAMDRYKLTRPGRDRLGELLAAERATLDQGALADAYRDFEAPNSAFKQLVTDWQLKDGATPNDHADAEYDAKIVHRLGELHEGFRPLVDRLVGLAPRLTPYPGRFGSALARVRAGEHTWLARPMIDSYHTVWFELHEDLIGLAGRSRAAEAAAGRAE
ncbi:MAG TPA: hypothetical protein VNP03_18010 [Pseudonocardia sp.]|nr:hypothetical protein [Pseudonocardia sp.]